MILVRGGLAREIAALLHAFLFIQVSFCSLNLAIVHDLNGSVVWLKLLFVVKSAYGLDLMLMYCYTDYRNGES